MLLTPRPVQALAGHRAIAIAAAVNHTVVLTDTGIVFTFGSNEVRWQRNKRWGGAPRLASCSSRARFPCGRGLVVQAGQLGVDPLGPAQVAAAGTGAITRLVSLKGRGLVGCCAGNRHTVLFSPNAVYTFGENAGQLGQPASERIIASPRYAPVRAMGRRRTCLRESRSLTAGMAPTTHAWRRGPCSAGAGAWHCWIHASRPLPLWRPMKTPPLCSRIAAPRTCCACVWAWWQRMTHDRPGLWLDFLACPTPCSMAPTVLVFAHFACRRVAMPFQRFPPEIVLHRSVVRAPHGRARPGDAHL